VKFVFQPAEEAAPPPGRVIGAEQMVEEGVLASPAVDAAFALHVMPLLEVGHLGFTQGAVWAASDLFDIHVRGRMSHGAYPHEGADPIVAGAAVVAALQSVVSRRIDARDPVVISVCRFSAGTAYNIVPDTAHLQGLVRTLDERVRSAALRLLVETAEQVARAYGCTAEVTTVRGAWLTANDPALERFVCARIEERPGGPRLTSFKPQMGAEDFSAFSRRVPSCFLFLGVRNEARGIVHMIHTPRFDVDEACLPLAVDTMTHALLETGARWAEVAPSLGRGA
jgi:amidohydrolase